MTSNREPPENTEPPPVNGVHPAPEPPHPEAFFSPAPAASRLPVAEPPPPEVRELADACVRFVERALGVTLDFTPETLPVLDHYLRTSRADLERRAEARPLVTHAAGAYFGEVVRRRFSSWWRLSADPADWQIQLEPVYLAFYPVAIAYDAIMLGAGEEGATSGLALDDEDRDAVAARLAELPAVDDEEFFAFTTRLEVIEIAVEASKARMMRDGLGDVAFTPEDYDDG